MFPSYYNNPTIIYYCLFYCRHICLLKRFHQRCLRTILKVKWDDYITNFEVLKTAKCTSIEAMLILKIQLRWAGHVWEWMITASQSWHFSVNWPLATVIRVVSTWGTKTPSRKVLLPVELTKKTGNPLQKTETHDASRSRHPQNCSRQTASPSLRRKGIGWKTQTRNTHYF